MNLLQRALLRLVGPKIEAPTPRFLAPVEARYEATQHSFDRSWLPGYVQGARQDLCPGERLELVRRARYFEQNNALQQKILDLIETNVVGTGIAATPDSSDAKWNEAALKWWEGWCKNADLTSRQHFNTLQGIIARAQANDGEMFAFLTTSADSGRPRIQLIETHRVCSAELRSYKAEGYTEFDGILFDAQGRPAFYIVTNDWDALSGRSPSKVGVIPAEQMVHFFEPSRAGQVRGVTLFHAVLHTLHDLDDLQKYEMLAAKDAASRANIVNTQTGEAQNGMAGVGRSQRAVKEDGTAKVTTTWYEQAFGGKTVVLKNGEKFEQSQSLRPSAAMREFWEYLTELACKGIGISFAAIQDYRGQWGGAALRGAIASDNRFYEVRTSVLIPGFDRIWMHAVGWAIRSGEIAERAPDDWWKVQWHSPRRSTVDIGRESKAILEELKASLRTYRDVLGETGSDWREILTQRATEEKFINDLAAKLGIDRNLIASLGNAPAAPQAPNPEAKPKAAGDDDEEPGAVAAVLAHDPAGVLAFSEPSSLSIPDDPAVALPNEIVWMPAGSHAISAASADGGSWRGTVLCDEIGARAVIAAYSSILASGRRVYLDRNHDDGEAVAWVKGFSWDPARGIVAALEWTPLGVQLLREKRYYSFSPAFLVNKETNRVAGLIAGHAAGGLVNAPAFGAAMPALIAARLAGADSVNPAPGGTPGNQDTTTHMKRELMLKILAALAVTIPADATDAQLTELLATHSEKLPAVLAAQKPDPKIAELEKEIAAINARDAADAKAAAEKLVQESVTAGAIEASQKDSWIALICADPKNAALLPKKAPATAAIVASDVAQRAAAGVQASNIVQVRTGALDALRAMQKESDPAKRGRIYCNEVRALIAAGEAVLPILAANSLGSVAGDLIVLRSLDLLKLTFPVLSAITTDFSAENAKQGQVIKSRIVSVPAVVAYDDTTGWASSDATTTDVPVTIGQPKGVQIELNNTELAGTNRDLFGEQVAVCHYALAKDLVDALYAIITQTNFSGAAKRTIKALASFDRPTVVAMATALSKRGVPGLRRTLLLNADYFGALSGDQAIVNLAGFQQPGIITGRQLPEVGGFNVIEAPNLPANAFTSTTGTLQGFGFTPDALVLATRVPADYTAALPGAAHGNVSVVTNPDVGISVQKVDFVDHKLAKAFSRIAWAYGVAKGQVNSGQCLTET